MTQQWGKKSHNASLVKQKTHRSVFLPPSRWQTLSTCCTSNGPWTVLPCTADSFTYTPTSALAHSEDNNDSQRWRIAPPPPTRRVPSALAFGCEVGQAGWRKETTAAGSAPPAVTWAPPRSVFNPFTGGAPPPPTNKPPLLCGAATLANMFVAIISPLRRVCAVPSSSWGRKHGKRWGNIYLSVDLKLIMILNWCSCSPLEPLEPLEPI